GIYGVAGLTATAIAPLLGEWVIRRLGFRALFTMAAAVAAVAGWIVLGLREQGRATPRPVQGFLWERGALGEVFRLRMGVPVLFLAGLLAGGAHGFLYPGLAALVTDQTPAGRRGVVVGIFSSVFLTGQTAGALVFGYVTHSVGYAFMWTILTSLLFAGFALSLRLEHACPTSGGATPLPPVTRGGLARERIARAKPARDRGESDTRRGGPRAPRADDVILSEVAGETGWRE